jgi:hypothetical protein
MHSLGQYQELDRAIRTSVFLPRSESHSGIAKDVPVDAFWSVTVYNREGYLHPNPLTDEYVKYCYLR